MEWTVLVLCSNGRGRPWPSPHKLYESPFLSFPIFFFFVGVVFFEKQVFFFLLKNASGNTPVPFVVVAFLLF